VIAVNEATKDQEPGAPREAGDGTYDVVLVGAGAARLNAAPLLAAAGGRDAGAVGGGAR
jgi:hypothetical protein